MAHDREKLMILATDRRIRMRSKGPPWFDLTDRKIERSTRTATRLADASKPQAEPRAAAAVSLPG